MSANLMGDINGSLVSQRAVQCIRPVTGSPVKGVLESVVKGMTAYFQPVGETWSRTA